jgi:hypothetical protein
VVIVLVTSEEESSTGASTQILVLTKVLETDYAGILNLLATSKGPVR